ATLDPATPQWKNAIVLNSTTGGSAQTNYQGTYQSFAIANGVTDGNLSNFLGSWGVDIGSNTAWAVVDHNSQFSVLSTPEPGALGLLALGGVAMMRRRWRRVG